MTIAIRVATGPHRAKAVFTDTADGSKTEQFFGPQTDTGIYVTDTRSVEISEISEADYDAATVEG